LDAWFADTGVGLSAEHGCFYRHPSKVGDLPNMQILDEGDALPSNHEPSDEDASIPQGPLHADTLPNIHPASFASLSAPPVPASSPAASSLNIPVAVAAMHSGGNSAISSVTTNASSISSPARNRPPRRSTNGWLALVDHVDDSWRDTIRPLFQHYTERTLGSFIEEKEVNITWHYKNADPEFGSWQAAELQVNLEKILSHMAVSVGSKSESYCIIIVVIRLTTFLWLCIDHFRK
jgi:hypothetical protein